MDLQVPARRPLPRGTLTTKGCFGFLYLRTRRRSAVIWLLLATISEAGLCFGRRRWPSLRRFFGTLLDAVAREHPEALVIDSVTEVLASGGGLDILHNVLYRAVKQSGVDVFLTAEKDVASKVTYVADNVIELLYEVYPYGVLREAVVRKIRGGKAGYSMPFIRPLSACRPRRLCGGGWTCPSPRGRGCTGRSP